MERKQSGQTLMESLWILTLSGLLMLTIQKLIFQSHQQMQKNQFQEK